ncbi:acetyl-CoA C-acyltransferase [Marininema halotolerans]|uniref:acetyl-CoA C-acyltransferase n=1 Tax=Marininema halotolerans TaxID=1155944 RepID=A0A1I6NSD8_9BACL|nr:acetyl-CoA C-acyltransferase [Marininema halotolerans]SFS30790.1 acetyl-CoA acyltransferase [Marininema halotolerans]
MREAVIVAAARTAVGKAPRGTLKDTRPDDLGAAVIQDLMKRTPQLDPKEIEDVILGCSFPEGEQGMNLARVVAVRAGLPNTAAGLTVNRFCSSGLQSIAIAAEKIMCGFADVVIAGGVESMSQVPMGGYKPAPNPWLMDNAPEVYMSMGHTAEEVATRYEVSREDQDAFALRSHERALKAIEEGKFKDEIVPITVKNRYVDEKGKFKEEEFIFDTDEGPRKGGSMETLAKLKPAFRVGGSVTAGNSSQTSDGAAGVIVMAREKAEELGIKPIAIFRSFCVGGVDPDVMGIGPIVAIPKALEKAGITLDQIDLIELNEAFASQAIQVSRHLGLNEEIMNVNGGAIALGHPLGCSGAKLTVSLLNEMKRRNGKYGLVSMCIGGGMGAAGVIEMVS